MHLHTRSGQRPRLPIIPNLLPPEKETCPSLLTRGGGIAPIPTQPNIPSSSTKRRAATERGWERKREPGKRRPFAGGTGHFHAPRLRSELVSCRIRRCASRQRLKAPGLNADHCRRVQTNSPPPAGSLASNVWMTINPGFKVRFRTTRNSNASPFACFRDWFTVSKRTF